MGRLRERHGKSGRKQNIKKQQKGKSGMSVHLYTGLRPHVELLKQVALGYSSKGMTNLGKAFEEHPDWKATLMDAAGGEEVRIRQTISALRCSGELPRARAKKQEKKPGRPKGGKNKPRKSPLIAIQNGNGNGHGHAVGMPVQTAAPTLINAGPKAAMAPMAVQMLQSLLVQTLLSAATAIENGDLTLGVKGGQ